MGNVASEITKVEMMSPARKRPFRSQSRRMRRGQPVVFRSKARAREIPAVNWVIGGKSLRS
jgi:hypothetical protein